MSRTSRFSRLFRSGRLATRLGIAGALAAIGLVAVAGPASAHANIVTGVAVCASPAGTGSVVTWTVANDYNLSESAQVTAATGGLSTVNPVTQAIAASGNGTGGSGVLPYTTATVTQTLGSSVAGSATLSVTGTFSDGFVTTNTGTVALPSSCTAPVQSIAGHIYLCVGGVPTLTETDIGTLGATGPQSVEVGASPLVPVSVMAGSYVMTATNPVGYLLVPCGGPSLTNATGTSATQTVIVPSGGAGVGNFYVMANVPAITVHKTADVASYSAVGQTITYSYLVTNTGDVSLSGVAVDDTHPGLTGLSCPQSTLLVGAAETCTAAYQVTAADLTAGSIVNTATAQGTPPGSTTPVTSPPSSVTVPATGITIVKQVCGSASAADCSAGGVGPWTSSAAVPGGNLVYWRVTVTNTGPAALSGITVTDAAVPTCSGAGPAGPLASGASFFLACTSTVTTSMTNVATATYPGKIGPPVSSSAQVVDVADVTVAAPAPVAVTVPVTG
jgi:uncharacterized repeat protein (TIGR01451 family)